MTVRGYGYRLPAGGLIDRTRTLRFTFNGTRLNGYAGDTLASALIASGVNLVARSFKYHRPRGFYGTGREDPNGLVAVRDAHGYDPAILAGSIHLAEGLAAHSVSGWPSLRFDFGGAAQLVSGLLGAGFYYKTFMWPSWHVFEPVLRTATGFGRPQRGTDVRSVQRNFATCDVLVIGAGPAGLMTAQALRGTGLNVVVADDQHTIGGSLLWEATEVDGEPAPAFTRKLVTELQADSAFTVLTSTLVAGAYENNFFTLVQTQHDAGGICAERHWTLKAHHVVLATGMIDRPLLFEGNDRPGIMLSSAVRRLVGEFAVAPARRLAVYTNNDSAYLTAINARQAGIDVVGIIDTRPEGAAIHAEEARQLGVALYFDSQIESTAGYRRLAGVALRGPDGQARQLACDGLAVSGGWAPLIQLAAHRGSKVSYDSEKSLFICRDLPAGWIAVGGVNGALDLQTVFLEAVAAAEAIAGVRDARPVTDLPAVRRTFRTKSATFGTVSPQWMPRHGSSRRIWVDLQNDVKVSDLEIAVSENYKSVEHLKRYTTLGMGTDQGRTSTVNGLAVLAELTGREMQHIGTTTFRPPCASVRMGTIASQRRGDLHRPRRYLPADAVHRELGAVMEDFGWERPDWYRSNSTDRESAVAVEMRAVRTHVGVFDSSSLGKIEVTGPDAAAFLAKFYVSDTTTLKPGRTRYSVMLRDDGVIFDDGIVTCIAAECFLANPTSGNADAVAAWLERWRQTEWPTLRVAVSPVTANWAAVTIAGPKARELLHRMEPNFDISSTAFRHMDFREGTVGGVVARVARVSFTGELQYEISVPARFGAALMHALLAEGSDLAPRAVGLEAWLRLRLEKGYIHVGTDTNGRTTPLDIGMGRLVAQRSGDFIGKRSLNLPFAKSREREQLVGLTGLGGVLQVGARILSPGHVRVPCPTEGYVTSACYSPSLGRSIGLALLERGHEREGEVVNVYSDGATMSCHVCKPALYDPTNERLRA